MLTHGRRHTLGSDDQDACAGVVRQDVIRGGAAGRDERVIPHRQADLSKVLGVDRRRALRGVGADDHLVSGIVELVQDLAGAGEQLPAVSTRGRGTDQAPVHVEHPSADV